MTPIPTTGPEAIVVSLENAKKLKEAGFPQDSLFFWWRYSYTATGSMKPKWGIVTRAQFHDGLENERCAAPTAEEILRKLPACTVYHAEEFRPGYRIMDGRIVDGKSIMTEADTLANAAAAMWVHLAAAGLLPQL